MTQRDDPLKRRPRTKRQDEIEDETEERLSRELAHLMRDSRYRDGDPDYRAYIQRQFRRVYDDPTGKPQGLRIGRPKPFVNELEPFHAERERRLRLGIKDEPASSTESNKPSPGSNKTILGGAGESPQSRRIRKAPLAATTRQNGDGVGSSASEAGFDIIPPSDRALSGLEGNARRHDPDPEDARRAQLERLERDERLHRTEKAIDAMIANWRRDDSLLGAEFLQRYRDGVGGARPISWSELMIFPKFRDEQERLKGHYLNWVRGTLEDSLWTPFLELGDGESINVSTNRKGDPLKLTVRWNPVTVGSVLNRNEGLDRDFARAFGRAEIEGIGNLGFTRRGDIYLCVWSCRNEH